MEEKNSQVRQSGEPIFVKKVFQASIPEATGSIVVEKVLIVNGYAAWPWTHGKLNKTMVEIASKYFEELGAEVKKSAVDSEWVAEEEVAKMKWADLIFYQTPVYWMGMPWQFKKWMDVVFCAGKGVTYQNDGRSSRTPQVGYGTGGLLGDTHYMLSLTFNAPSGAFNSIHQPLFRGRSVEDLWLPFHMAQGFLGMKGQPSFVCHDVLKNPEVVNDKKRLVQHLKKHFEGFS